ncbi:sialoadhesin [Anolis sagrei]|uniref:sialoadhesin n=1 Tax=Anolis sagrei TaxID=38937 RepID=UPI0035229AB6
MPVILFILGLSQHVLQAWASWGASYPGSLKSVRGSCAVFPCTFFFPNNVAVPREGIAAIWYKDQAGKKVVAFHSARPDMAEAQFRDRTELLGDPLRRNCTLLLRSLTGQDAGSYNFRFEVSEGNRWTEQKALQLTVADAPERPGVSSPEELREGIPAEFKCSSPYVCPFDESSALRWVGYVAEDTQVTEEVQLDTSGAVKRQILRLTPSWKDHGRKLSCELSVGGQTAAGRLTLSVKYVPKGVTLSLSPSAKNIRVGDTASLTCGVNSSFPGVSAYKWFKDGLLLPGGAQVKTLRSVARGDYGLYRCEAENPVGSVVAEGVTLHVFSAVLSVSPSSDIREGEAVTLTCDVPGEEEQGIHYSWYKNNLWIKEGTAQSLVFQEAAVGDTGYYSCKVQNDKGSEASQALPLNVLYPPRTPWLALFQEAQEGRSAIVHCTVDSNPASALSLFRAQHLLASTSSHSAPSQRVSVSSARNSLRLEIREVAPEDEGDYRCQATNTLGSATAEQFFGAQTARVVVQPSKELPEGAQVSLTCVATVVPGEEPRFTWYKNGKWLQEGKEDALVFPKANGSDSGTFHCAAQSTGGLRTSPPVTLRVFYAPRQLVLTSFLETQGARLGVIQCAVDSDPPSEVALFKGDAPLGSSTGNPASTDPRVTLAATHNALKATIKDLGLEDEGQYVCSAQNRYGEASTSIDFVVEAARILVSPSSSVREGESARLSCLLQSSNNASSSSSNFTWFKDALPLSEAFGDSLEFHPLARKDAGTYLCRVETPTASKTSDPIALSVLYPPGELEVAVFVETKRGRVAIFEISVDSKPPAQFALYKGSNLIASSDSRAHSQLERISITSQAPNAIRVELRDVAPADEGGYNVTATNPYGSSSRPFYFHVQTARVLVSPSPEVREGSDLTLTCDVMGSAPEDSTFSWFRNGKRVQGGSSSSEATLAFHSITSQETGSYYCKVQAPNGTGTNISPSVSITVVYPPRKPQVTSFLRTEGQPMAVLQCAVESEPQALLEISKEKQVLASSTSPTHSPRIKASTAYNSLSMEIWDVVMEDEGEYVCTASNALGKASSSATFTANVARIWISPLDVREGNAVNLTCSVDSSVDRERHYTWYKDSRRCAEGPSKTLVLPRATVADAGTYYCSVKTAQGRLRNSTLGTLGVLYPPRNVRVQSFLETQKGRLAAIECSVESNPPSTLLLLRGETVLASSAFRGNPEQRVRRVASSSPNALRVEIPGVGPEDQGDYECRASNAFGQASASLDFVVETTRVVIRPGPEVCEGSPVSLTCEDEGTSSSSSSGALFTWYKDARWLSQGPAPSLLLQEASTADIGTYSCQVQSLEGSRASPPVALRLLYAPKRPSLTSFLETQTGNRAVIQCQVESYPPSELALLREGKAVASSRGPDAQPDRRLRVHLAQNSLKLEIREVLLQDEGQYRCLANNTFGRSEASIHFSVESARVALDPGPDAQEGASATLTCAVSSRASGDMNYTWYRNGKHVRQGPDPQLLLGRVARADAGSYQCQAEGAAGQVTSPLVSLNVLYPPDSPSLGAYLDNQEGKVGIISCQVDSHPRSWLALYKGGRLLASTNGSQSSAGRRFVPFPSYNSLRVEIQDVVAGDSGSYVCQVGNQFGEATGTIDFSAETLSQLRLFQILAGLFVALVCVALFSGLVFAVIKNWHRMIKGFSGWKGWQRKSPKAVETEVEEKEEKENEEEEKEEEKKEEEETVQLSDQTAVSDQMAVSDQTTETPPSSRRFCWSYRRLLQMKAETTPKEEDPGQNCTSTV